MIRCHLAPALLVITSFALASENPPPSGNAPLSALADLMTGVFSSAEQAAADPEFRPVRLVMVPIWTQRKDGPWLLISWDRGFNAEDRQVWGAEKGGYRFVKLAASP